MKLYKIVQAQTEQGACTYVVAKNEVDAVTKFRANESPFIPSSGAEIQSVKLIAGVDKAQDLVV